MPRKGKTTRRGKNEGSVYRRKDGRWVGQVTTGYRPDNGKPIREYSYADTREDVAHWVAVTLAALNKDTVTLSNDIVIKDFLHNWLSTFKSHEVCSRTMELYYSSERLHIVPALGDIPLKDLTPIKVQTFLYQLQAQKHLSTRSISQIRGTLIQMYDHAIDMQLVENNPARNAKLPKQPRKAGDEDEKVISIVQRVALLKAAADDPIMGPPVTMLMLTGMRVGEMLALQWRHIDFKAKTITIQQSLTRELTFDKEGRTEKSEDALGATKTRTSHRVIQAPDLVLDRLREWMKYVASRKGGLATLVPDGFVFISTRTMGMRTYSGFRASYRHFLARNGFEPEGMNLHRFRHTYASMLLEQEVNPKIVQKLLGHRDVSTTLGVYTHVVPEVFSGVTTAVNNASQRLLDGTYAPRMSMAQVRDQLRQLDPTLSDDLEIQIPYR